MRAFTKMHGTGNDFVVLDALRAPLPTTLDWIQTTQALCQRRRGVGSDGLLLLDEPDHEARSAGASVRMRMWNPDGSEDMCGNGLRCVAKLAFLRGYVSSGFVVQTWAGLRACEVLKNGEVRVAMGQPQFARLRFLLAATSYQSSTRFHLARLRFRTPQPFQQAVRTPLFFGIRR
jgi:diaminopimelate epimerase